MTERRRLAEARPDLTGEADTDALVLALWDRLVAQLAGLEERGTPMANQRVAVSLLWFTQQAMHRLLTPAEARAIAESIGQQVTQRRRRPARPEARLWRDAIKRARLPQAVELLEVTGTLTAQYGDGGLTPLERLERLFRDLQRTKRARAMTLPTEADYQEARRALLAEPRR
jgi:hypothetical protein